MANVSFTNLKLTVDKTVNTIDFNGTKIEVLKYLPIQDKNDLIQIALQKAYESGYYNDMLLDVYFHLNIVYLYTNLNITDKQKEDELKLFDKLSSNGLIDMIIAAMDAEEYKYLYSTLEKAVEDRMRYKNSAAAVLQSIIQDLPKNAAIASEMIDGWDPDKFQSVQDMIKMASEAGINPPAPALDNIVELPTS